jgi:2-polyprenyl-3-methyl-5-hydroxy-6-metoxy-1,4-benzoquinol methylase
MDQDTTLASQKEGVGLTTLQYLSETTQLNQWMFETIYPYVGGRILEIGSGIGNISSQFVNAGTPITLSDLDAGYCRMLHEKFDREPLVRGIHQVDFAHPFFETAYSPLTGKFDTVFALNVVEHISDDKQAVANARSLLAPGGRLIILVPAYAALYNRLDRNLDHYRRYTRKSVRQLLSGGFEVLHTQYFNLAGIFGWFFSGTIFRKKNLSAGELGIYNKFVPLFRMADELTLHKAGLSVIAVACRK